MKSARVETRPANPFPIEAVATYGASVRTCEELSYMGRALAELHAYLKGYPVRSRRYGGAVGLTGGHGSGKTHLLAWLSREGEALQSLPVATAYGKIDSANLFDLYRQVVSQVPRETLLRLLDLATRKVAVDEVQSTRATEDLGDRIPGVDDLKILYEEGTLDRDKIGNLLEARLLEVQVPAPLPRTVLALRSPSGEAAYHWLVGDESADLPSLGVSYSLRQLGTETGSATPDATAVDALETLAALHRLAEVPFVLFIDQLEVLLRADPARQQILFSVIKKLIEHLARQHALVFIAGTDEGWGRLPRDVAPRLRHRQPLRVGDLSEEETSLLLGAYLRKSPAFGAEGVAVIHQLSGGNPREILRIAHHAFERTEGDPPRADEPLLVDCAQESGSIEDRFILALNTADEVLGRYGTISADLALPDGVVVHRLVRDGAAPFLALIVLKATDKLSESVLAHRVNAAKRYLEREWPGTAVIVVTVGYSSAEVRALLSHSVATLVYRESEFRGELEREAARIASRRTSAPGASPTPDPKLLSVLEQISGRLAKLEATRRDESEEIRESFQKDVGALREPEREAREIRTRSELLVDLDRLDGAMAGDDAVVEREMVQAILVSNEAQRNDSRIDTLGGLYLDVLSVRRLAASDPNDPLVGATRILRAEIASEIRKTLLQPDKGLQPGLSYPYRLSGGAALAGVLAWVLGGVVKEPHLLTPEYASDLLALLGPSVAAGAAVGLATYLTLLALDPIRRFRVRVRRLRRDLGERLAETGPAPQLQVPVQGPAAAVPLASGGKTAE